VTVITNPDEALKRMQEMVLEGKFEFAPRKKLHVSSKLARIIVEELTPDDYESHGYDFNGSSDLVFVFISGDGIRYYIKFKFINDETAVKFISFHEAEF
jgi:hypothetical protein